jgi:hypothetical protein
MLRLHRKHQQLADLISSDLEKVTNTPTMYPIIEVLYEATGSKAGTVFMMMIIYFVIGCSQFNILASVSRLTWYVVLSRHEKNQTHQLP